MVLVLTLEEIQRQLVFLHLLFRRFLKNSSKVPHALASLWATSKPVRPRIFQRIYSFDYRDLGSKSQSVYAYPGLQTWQATPDRFRRRLSRPIGFASYVPGFAHSRHRPIIGSNLLSSLIYFCFAHHNQAPNVLGSVSSNVT